MKRLIIVLMAIPALGLVVVGCGDDDAVNTDAGTDTDADTDTDSDADTDTDTDTDIVLPCDESTEGTILDSGAITILDLTPSESTDQALLVYIKPSGTELGMFVSIFDGDTFGTPLEIMPPAGMLHSAGAVSACLAGPNDRPLVAFDVLDGSDFRNCIAVGDGAGGFLDSVLVEGEPMSPSTYCAPYLACSNDDDRAVVLTGPRTGTLWVDAWDGSSMLGPAQVIPTGWYVALLEGAPAAAAGASGFNPAGRMVVTYIQTDGASTYQQMGLLFSDTQFTTPEILNTESSMNSIGLFAAASPHSDRGLVVFTDESGTYQAVRVTGEVFGTMTTLDDPGVADGRAWIDYFSAVDHAAISYETQSRDLRVVLDDGADFATPVTVGIKAQISSAFHVPFVRFRSSHNSDKAFILFDGDSVGNGAISVVHFDGETFDEPLLVTDSPEYIAANAGYSGAGETALVVFQTIDLSEEEEGGVFTYSAPLEDGVLGAVERADCDITNHGIGDFDIVPSRTAARFGVRIGYGGAAEEGTQLRMVEDGAPGLGLIYGFGEIKALSASDRFLVATCEGDDLLYEIR
jgi:hypothetical protein